MIRNSIKFVLRNRWAVINRRSLIAPKGRIWVYFMVILGIPTIVLFLWFIAITGWRARDSNTRPIEEKFNRHRPRFAYHAYQMILGEVRNREDGFVGKIVPKEIGLLGVELMVIKGGVVFFECRSNSFYSEGILYDSCGEVTAGSLNPPTEPRFKILRRLGSSKSQWYYYLSQ